MYIRIYIYIYIYTPTLHICINTFDSHGYIYIYISDTWSLMPQVGHSTRFLRLAKGSSVRRPSSPTALAGPTARHLPAIRMGDNIYVQYNTRYVYIYIYNYTHIVTCMCIYIYIDIYIYIYIYGVFICCSRYIETIRAPSCCPCHSPPPLALCKGAFGREGPRVFSQRGAALSKSLTFYGNFMGI